MIPGRLVTWLMLLRCFISSFSKVAPIHFGIVVSKQPLRGCCSMRIIHRALSRILLHWLPEGKSDVGDMRSAFMIPCFIPETRNAVYTGRHRREQIKANSLKIDQERRARLKFDDADNPDMNDPRIWGLIRELKIDEGKDSSI